MPALEWSTPVRRSSDDAHSLDQIPVEIYEKILSHFQENDDMTRSEVRQNLRNIAPVCRYFSSVALPRIFAELNLSCKYRDTSTAQFVHAIATNEESATSVARYVKTCKIASLSLHSTFHILDSGYLISCLEKLTSVNTVDLHRVLIDKDVVEAMKKLRLLRSLRLSGCQPWSRDVDVFRSFIHSLRLERLVLVSQVVDDDLYATLTPPNLSFRHLKHLEVDYWAIIQRLSGHENVFPIQCLIIYFVFEPQLLQEVFLRMPKLSELHIYKMIRVESITFPETILPKLSFFEGPPLLVSSLIQMRPIRKVWLLGTLHSSPRKIPFNIPPLGRDFWTILGYSAAPIQEITMPRHLYDVGSLHQHLPKVSILKVCWCPGNWVVDYLHYGKDFVSKIQTFCNKWPPNPSIIRLVFDFSRIADKELQYYDLKAQHNVLCTDIMPKFPNLEEVNFNSVVNWRRAPGSERTWRANIPKVKREYFYSNFGNYRGELVDYDNCFADAIDDMPQDLSMSSGLFF